MNTRILGHLKLVWPVPVLIPGVFPTEEKRTAKEDRGRRFPFSVYTVSEYLLSAVQTTHLLCFFSLFW